jgi:tRNA1(Val) A37 N6-methylase TrmN6
MKTTLDGILNHRVTLEQPEGGFRVAVDTVLLAAAVPIKPGEAALDLGCGVGGAMLCLAARVPDVTVTGLEIQNELVELCRSNIARNNFLAQITVTQGDATHLPDDLTARFDHVLMNPPYHDEIRHDVSAHDGKRIANTEREGDLALWIASARRALKQDGVLTMIYRADRQDEILTRAARGFGEVKLLAVLPKSGAAAKRIILQLRKGGQASVRTCKSFILHQTGGGYTDEAEAALRHAKNIEFVEQNA